MHNRSKGNDTGEEMRVLKQGDRDRDKLGDVLRSLNSLRGV